MSQKFVTVCRYGYHCVCLCYRKDAFTGAEYIQEGLQIEQASVLYNLCEWMLTEEGREGGREGGRKGGRKGREQGKKEGKEEGREGGGRKEGREERTEEGREGRRERRGLEPCTKYPEFRE